MTSAATLEWLWRSSLALTPALLLAMLLRPLLRRLGHAGHAYAAWALCPLALAAPLLPAPQGEAVLLSLQQGVSSAAAPLAHAPTGVGTPWLALWAAGALLVAAHAFTRHRRLAHLLQPLQPVAGLPGVFQSAGLPDAGPMVWGLWLPCIVVPHDFAQRFSARQQALVLAHERARLRRGDTRVQALVALLQALFWFHPLVHVAARLLRQDQELACDREVMQRHRGAAHDYALALAAAQDLDSASSVACHWHLIHPLNRRIMELTRPTPGRLRQAAALSTLALAAALVATACASDARGTHGARYKVDFSMSEKGPDDTGQGQVTRRVSAQIGVEAGQLVQLRFGTEHGPATSDCTVSMKLREAAADQVELELPLACQHLATGSKAPRLITSLGRMAEVETGDPSRSLRVTMLVNRWPADQPWPGTSSLP